MLKPLRRQFETEMSFFRFNAVVVFSFYKHQTFEYVLRKRFRAKYDDFKEVFLK